MRGVILLVAALALAGCEELLGDQPESNGQVDGPAVFNAPATQTLSVSDRAPGRLMGFRIDSEITFGQRQARVIVITLPPSYQFNGFNLFGAGARIGAYGFEFNPASAGPDRLFPIYAIDGDSAWVDTNLDGQTNPLKPAIEYSLDGQQNHVITITLPRGGDGSTSFSEAGFSSDIMAFLRTGVFSNPSAGGATPITIHITSVDPDTGDADDSAGSPPESFQIDGNVVIEQTQLSAAVLPASRSVTFGTTATAFATIANGGASTAQNCAISLQNVIKGGFSYQTTDPNTNALTGTINTPVDIPPGGTQSFVIAFTPVQEFYNTPVPFTTEPLEFVFSCSTGQAIQLPGVNQLTMASGTTPTPDAIAVAATATNDGILYLGGTNVTGAIGMAMVNIGATGTLTIQRANINNPIGGGTAGLDFLICETTLGSPAGRCMFPPTRDSLRSPFNQNEVRTFTLLVRGNGQTVSNNPAVNRIQIEFVDDDGVVRGSTSVAVTTDAAPT